MTQTPEQIAASLTKADREAMTASHWTARQSKYFERLGLTYRSTGPHGRVIVKFRPLGQQVRTILENRNDAG